MVYGECECSLIKIKVTDSIKSLSYCHCGQCRRLHGAAYASWIRIDTKSVHILAGEDDLKIYASSNELNRYFCANCGSSIMCRPKVDETRSWLALGILDGVFDLPKGEHMFFDSRPAWDNTEYTCAKWTGFPESWSGYAD